MGTHPIENIMDTTMTSIKDMVDVNTIVGDTVVMGDGTLIIPISKVSFGFVAGGGEYGTAEPDHPQQTPADHPFAGGGGAGVSLNPMAFLVIHQGDVKLLPVQYSSSPERILERLPKLMEEVKKLFDQDEKQNAQGQA
ncbi:MAG: GerW family sporulation protein [Eubacteriales bacterium]|nr:GerW family sporulation protein [Eubacteriales bacterium]